MRPFSSILLLCFLALALLPGCDLFGSDDGDDGPRLEGIPGKIVYTKSVRGTGGEDPGQQIFVTDHEGTRQLTSTDTPFENAVTPAWSPDGKRIAYARGTGTGGEELYVMRADGSGKRPLIDDPPFERLVIGIRPAWSPSGDRVAFQRCITCNLGGSNAQIFVAHLESGVVDTLTSFSSDNAFPTWSPDGEQIAFTSDRAYAGSEENRGDTDLYVMDADGSNVRRLTTSGKAGGGVWNPSGTKIAYAYQKVSAQLFAFDMVKGESVEMKTDLTGAIKLFPVSWSSDGNQLFLTAGDYPDVQPYVLDINTGKAKKGISMSSVLTVADWHTE